MAINSGDHGLNSGAPLEGLICSFMEPSVLRVRPIGAQCKRAMLRCKAAPTSRSRWRRRALAAFRRERQHEISLT